MTRRKSPANTLKRIHYRENEIPKIDIKNIRNHKLLIKSETLNLLKKLANTKIPNIREYKKFRKNVVISRFGGIEQDWVDYYLQPIINFMGSYDNWNIVIPFDFIVLESSVGSIKSFEDFYVIRFTGAHWYSKKPGDKRWFDPYTEYQYKGSNQFCQTYALMYILDMLPNKVNKEKYNSFTKYYYYSKKALEFIKNYYIPTLKKSKSKVHLHIDDEYEDIVAKNIKDIEFRVDELLKYFYMTVNCIELTNFD